MSPETAVAAVLSTAREFLGAREELGNRGLFADFFNWWVIRDWRDYPQGGKGAPWCATYVGTSGRLALGLRWPVPTSPAMSSAQGIAAWGQAEGVIAPTPRPGDILCIWRGGRFGHVALVQSRLTDGRVRTIEGNTNDSGSAEGVGVFELIRVLRPEDRLVRWSDKFVRHGEVGTI